MDVMQIRRMLMTMGVSGVIGEFTKYEKKKLTFPNASNSNSFAAGATIPCSFIPKLMMFSGGTDTSGNIISGVYVFIADVNARGAAGTMYRNAANNNLVTSGALTRYMETEPTAAANGCFYYNGNIIITRTGANGWWSNTDEYTFEIYG